MDSNQFTRKNRFTVCRTSPSVPYLQNYHIGTHSGVVVLQPTKIHGYHPCHQLNVFLYNYHIGTHSFPAFGKHACSLGQHLRPVAGIPTVNVFLYNYHIETYLIQEITLTRMNPNLVKYVFIWQGHRESNSDLLVKSQLLQPLSYTPSILSLLSLSMTVSFLKNNFTICLVLSCKF